MLLRVNPRSKDPDQAAQIRKLLKSLRILYGQLNDGIVPDIGPEYPVPNDIHPVDVLFGYGAGAFSLPGAKPLPEALAQFDFEKPLPGKAIATYHGTQPDVNGDARSSGIFYARGGLAPHGDFALQFTGPTPFRVERAVVETWKILHDFAPAPARAPLEVSGVFLGNQRDDRRSWIDFYDGTSNLTEYQREQVIVIPDSGLTRRDKWTAGGTYLGFIRIGINLRHWRGLPREEQERIIGRDKLDGCPFISFPDPQPGQPLEPGQVIAGCTPRTTLRKHPPKSFRDPGPLPAPNTTAAQSHMQRSNQNRHPGPKSDPSKLESFRIYRQGYPFLEPNPHEPTDFERQSGFRAGLNFVSFQNLPHRLIGMLTTEGWLGDTNLGGLDRFQAKSVHPLTAYAAGMFLVPPTVEGEPFPGAKALGARR
jgi:deferrochelatase/peroxidase EfeB